MYNGTFKMVNINDTKFNNLWIFTPSIQSSLLDLSYYYSINKDVLRVKNKIL